MDTAALVVTFLAVIAYLAHRQSRFAKDSREYLEAILERQERLEREQRGLRAEVEESANTNAEAAILAKAAVHAAQRAEERARSRDPVVLVGTKPANDDEKKPIH